jgi:hypothetical protein
MCLAGQAGQAEHEKRISSLARGFDALLAIAQRLTSQERKLQSRLRFAHNEVRGIVVPFAIFSTVKDERTLISSRSRAATAAVTDQHVLSDTASTREFDF